MKAAFLAPIILVARGVAGQPLPLPPKEVPLTPNRITLDRRTSSERVKVESWQSRAHDTSPLHLSDLNSKIRGISTRSPATFSRDGAEADVVRAGRAAATELLNVDLPATPDGVERLMNADRGDVLISRYVSTGLSSDLWIWDTPFQTAIIIDLPARISSPSQLATFLEGFIKWRESEIVLIRVAPELGPDPTKSYIDVDVETVLTERGIYSVRIECLKPHAGGPLRLGIWVSKSIVSTHYPEWAKFVPERFPPLASRLKSVPREQLLLELGKGLSLDTQRAPYPKYRDRILITELLGRGAFSDLEFREIVLGTGHPHKAIHDTVRERFRSILELSATNSENQLRRLVSQCLKILVAAPEEKFLRQTLGASFFGILGSRGNLSSEAFFMIENGVYIDPSLKYLEHTIQTQAELQRLVRITVPAVEAGQKEAALRQIRERMSSTEAK